MKNKISRMCRGALWLIPATLLLFQGTFGQEAPVKGIVKDKLGRPPKLFSDFS